jgi:Tol biopolymer transport system component
MYMDEVNAFDSTWPVLRRVSIDGGEVIPVIGPHEPGVSEDYWRFAFAGGWSNAGNQIALLHMTAHDTVSNPLELAVASLDGAITRAFPYTPESFALTWDHQRVQWSAEGPDEFLYFSRGGQLWKQPVAGGPATQVTSLDEPLFDFDWSPDGHRLVVSLWTTLSDVVRLTGFP